MANNKTLYITIIVILVIIIIIGGVYWFMQSQNSSVVKPNPVTSSETTPSATTTNGTTHTLSYGEALALFGDYRIQFDSMCLITPNDVTFKAGTPIMIDNRSNKRTTISLDNVPYSINAYDWLIVRLTTTAALPHTISVDCGTGKNQGQILLQK